jgi:hypothetical protein
VRRLVLSFGIVLATACANPEEPPRDPRDAGFVDAGRDRDGGVPDAGMDRDGGPLGRVLRSVNLAPATGRASSPSHNINGRLRVDGTGRATSDQHELRGGIVPGAGR